MVADVWMVGLWIYTKVSGEFGWIVVIAKFLLHDNLKITKPFESNIFTSAMFSCIVETWTMMSL